MASERLQVILELVTGQYKKEAREAATATGQIGTSAQNTTGAVQGMGSRMSGAIGPMLGIAGGAVAAKKAFDGTVGAFVDFDAAMTESLAIMGDVSDVMRKDMSDAAREVAKTTTFSASEAAEAYFFLASAGLDAVQSVEAMPAVAQFAQAGMFDMARATDLLTDAQSALGLSSNDVAENLRNMTRLSDVLVGANTLANASVEQFAEALTNKAANAMSQLNIEVEDGVAVLAAWADQGVKGSAAGERFNIVTRDLQTAARKNADTFAEMNISVFDAGGNFRNLADIVEDLENALAGMTDEQRGAALAQLGFTDRSIAATRSLLGLSGQIRTYSTELKAAGGITEEVAGKQLESARAQWELFKSALADTGLEIGEGLVPALMKLLPVLQGTAEVLAVFAGQSENASYWTLALSSAVGNSQASAELSNRLWGQLGISIGGAQDSIRGTTEAIQDQDPAIRAAITGYGQIEQAVDAADRAHLRASRDGIPRFIEAIEKIPPAVTNTARPLQGLIGDMIRAKDAAEEVFGVLRAASDPVFAAVSAWEKYVEALSDANDENAGVQEELDVLRTKIDMRTALERLGNKYDETMRALSLATDTPIREIERMLGLIEGFDGQTFTAVFETEFRTRGTPPPQLFDPNRTNQGPGAIARQHGGPVNAGNLYRVGERNQPELYMIPGDNGAVFSHADSRRLIDALSKMDGGGGDTVINLHGSGVAEADIGLLVSQMGVIRRTETMRR